MQKMSGLDLQFAASELAHLAGKRVAKIRRTEEGVFLFKIGSGEMLFEPGVRLHLTRQALKATEAPDGFVGYLRKNFEGKTAAEIMQVPSERIVEITTKSKEKLVFELFRKGNVIAIGEDGIIAACLEKDETGGRRIARGERYAYPKATSFEIKKPEKIAFAVQLNEKGEPVSYSVDGSGQGRAFQTFSEAADFYYANAPKESEEEKAASANLKKLQGRLESQQKTLAGLSEKRAQAKIAGDAIYADFEKVESLLSLVRQMKKAGKNEEEINRELERHKAKIKGAEIEIEM